MGTGRHGNILYAVDFGLAMEFCDAERCRDLEGRPFGGSLLLDLPHRGCRRSVSRWGGR